MVVSLKKKGRRRNNGSCFVLERRKEREQIIYRYSIGRKARIKRRLTLKKKRTKQKGKSIFIYILKRDIYN